MALSVADIDRWNAEAVREVFHAASARSRSALGTSRELATLSVFAAWEGASRDAAAHQNAAVRQDLDAHGNEALAVARAAEQAAGGIDKVKAELATLRADVGAARLQLDAATSQVVAIPQLRYTAAEWAKMQTQRAELQTRLNAIVAEANGVDQELATAINMADGDAPIPSGPHDNRPDVQRALEQPLPQDAKQFADLWNKLTPQEKDWLYGQDHDIGNHPGMPWDPPDHLGKDYYNRLHLPELAQQTQADVDRLQHRVDELAAQIYLGDHTGATTGEFNALAPRLLAARHSLDGYQAVQTALNRNDGVRRYLGLIDNQGRGAVAIANPDYAKRNAILVPGTGQDLATFEGSDLKSLAMYNSAMAADPNLRPGDVAVTTWMGYDRPMDLFEAAWPDRARAGGGALDAFESGQRASHVGAPSIDTVIGHSYGSTLVGAAASGGHHLDANNVVAVGSPGMLVRHAGDLNLEPGANVYAMRARNDIIELVTDMTLGHDPVADDFGATRLFAAAGPSSDPLGLTPSVAAHSSYWSEGNPALLNLGAVIAGVPAPQAIPSSGGG
ncbi:MAG: alpha/beta hydrolase [Actinomycetota bacterium]|uniref:Alpha/beta hydrolase family protein n=1 Tax=Mycobacterium lentiflavum TaxID=141349 RepID=A0ABY3V2U8_MYCLN|nr:alpha/beta hydrolase [Mycobacterium lentiflavum]MEE3067254.1 alpha/beta hydrolase [Actinomycetota bacterium]ULP44264.1 alpha/beta hydrolase family protein [Mycobacterium lentiflavum]